ncbi:ATP-binding protein [Romboutsia maritimum]|uniref:ATP-binding protein n=1 Tax=Romboutsia maritimum TaxID=2020948 RepID=A0A371IR33_9FIRM|nr:sensor histidine kinase [Romboutsia maritimum]RDY22946.1 ATP-binding protein [Romboutsia maritimum]
MLNSNLFWNIFTSTSVIVEWVVCKKIFDYTSNKRNSNIKINLQLILIILFAILLELLNVFPNTRVIISIVLTCLFYKVNYEVSISKLIINSLMYWMVLLGIDAISMSFIIWINNLDNMSVLLCKNIYRIKSISLSKSTLISILFGYKRLRINDDVRKRDLAYMITPIGANIVSFFVIFKYVFNFAESKVIDESQILVISILLGLSSISLILAIRQMQIDNKLILESNMIKEKMDTQYKYYMNIKENQIRTRQLYHDMKNHIICIKKLYEDNDDSREYIENLEKQISNCNNLFNTGNMILDIMLDEKQSICKKNNISFDSNIDFTKCDFIDVLDVCSIFSNILDNAVEACQKCENANKYIYLEGRIIEKFFVIKAENSKSNKIIIKNNKVITDKENEFLHGLGIKSMMNSVKKYEGQVVLDYTDDKFIVKILIPLIEIGDVCTVY